MANNQEVKKRFTFIRHQPPIIKYGLLGVAIVIIAVFGGRFINHQIADSGEKPAPTTSLNTANSQPKKSSKTSSNNAANQLPNSGPGDVMAIFIGTFAIAASLHYVVQLRRGPST